MISIQEQIMIRKSFLTRLLIVFSSSQRLPPFSCRFWQICYVGQERSYLNDGQSSRGFPIPKNVVSVRVPQQMADAKFCQWKIRQILVYREHQLWARSIGEASPIST